MGGTSSCQCTVKIQNNCTNYNLCSPSMHLVSGGCTVPLPGSIESSDSGTAWFTKTTGITRGSVGVFTYNLLTRPTNKISEKIAVMFSVPYDLNLYSNWYAAGIFDVSKECDYNLFSEMYYDSNKSFIIGKATGPRLIYEGEHVTIRADMLDSSKSVLTVQMFDRRYEDKSE